MNVERLALLRDALRAPLPEKTTFDLRVWRKETPCGTTCCAIGLAMGMPEFQAMGLSATSDDGSFFGVEPKLGRRTNFSAAEGFFATPKETTRWLFEVDYYDAGGGTLPTEVAARIDALITGGTLAKAKKIMRAG